MDDDLRLAELLAARLCHDIGGLLATLAGMLELAGDESAPKEVNATALDASAELMRRLHLLREAWTGEGSGLDLAGLQALSRGLPGAHRLRLDVSGLPDTTVFPPRMGRLVLNTMLLAAESLPRGGTITIATPGGQDVLIAISGTRGGWPPGLAAFLADDSAAWSALDRPRTLMAPFVALLGRRLGIRVSMLMPTGRTRQATAPLLLSPETIV